MRRILREPLLHFLVLGAVLFGAYEFLGEAEIDSQEKIVVSAAQIANLEQGFARTWQRPPTAQELEGLIEDHIKSEVYDREARALGLDRDDIVIRRRLRLKMEFFAEDMAGSEPSDAELRAYLAAHPEQFRSEDSVTFRHVFLSPARRGSLESDTQQIAAQLASAKGSSDVVPGDAFLLGESFRGMSQSEAGRTFGEQFAAKLFALEPGSWEGPIPSGYGLHFVLVDERMSGSLPPLDAVRPAVEREWANTRRVEQLEEFYRALRQGYDISVEMPRSGREARNEAAGEIQ
jgi:hypothetical protein